MLLLQLPLLVWAQTDLFNPQMELIGTSIDSIKVTAYLKNEPENKNFHSQFKVLEFWATWCKPCLKAVPHLNKLQEQFKDRNIIFLSLTYESSGKTVKTLQKVNFKTIVATDTSRTIHQKLRIDYKGTMPLPRTVLIDDNNKIVWYGSPKGLTKELIEKFLTKKDLHIL